MAYIEKIRVEDLEHGDIIIFNGQLVILDNNCRIDGLDLKVSICYLVDKDELYHRYECNDISWGEVLEGLSTSVYFKLGEVVDKLIIDSD